MHRSLGMILAVGLYLSSWSLNPGILPVGRGLTTVDRTRRGGARRPQGSRLKHLGDVEYGYPVPRVVIFLPGLPRGMH